MATAPVGKVVILHEPVADDARPDERDLLVQVDEVSAALRRLAWKVDTLTADLDFGRTLSALRNSGASCIFNLVESLGGCGELIALVPSLLSAAGIRYTGSRADAIYLSSQKLIAKRWMRLHDVATPAWVTSGKGIGSSDRRWIVKSVWEHASLGLDGGAVVRGARAVEKRLQSCRAEFGGQWFAERYIDGREFNVSVMEEAGELRILPIAEIRFDGYAVDEPRIVGYAAKWQVDSREYRSTPRCFPKLSPRQDSRIREAVQRCWRLFGLRGYARIDIRMDSRGVPWVLEINANPCLARDAGFAAAAEMAGISYDRAIRTILESALETDRHAIESMH